ncbi:DUF2505 domain-containing protein [Mycolicibacterium sarraceniae]|uniref:DUF2505 domain-containing protein n=1 Tax=Mycolicibacterium sarraceniae TaxID=1534348 RepID=A0A7I7STJ9_9MYCO|nr:DUF2505 domain-containing protein [Mycolicibacterium sarraceniae]BBY59146.1 hypothetical protein MSAR_22820 [Mycolicibacterium sarraceniae]
MSRRLDYVIELDRPVADLYLSFTSREYWEDLVAEHHKHTDSELTRFESSPNGTDIAFTHTVSRRDVPSLIAPVVPLRLTITREQHFDAFDAAKNSADGHYRALVPAAPLHFDGTYVLQQAAGGSELRLSSLCKVNVPLLGGKIEKWACDGLRGLFDHERDFTRDWIAGHY